MVPRPPSQRVKDLPDWVRRHKTENVEIQVKGSHYYAYTKVSVQDPATGRWIRKTGAYLGKVTPGGLVPAKHRRERPRPRILDKGNLDVTAWAAGSVGALLEKQFPADGESLLAAAALKLAYRSPLKNLKHYHESSTSHRVWTNAHVSPDALTDLLRRVGSDRGGQVAFFRELSTDAEHVAVDLTQIVSQSENIDWLEKGYNAHGGYPDQVQLVLFHGLRGKDPRPVLLKLLPGSLRDQKVLKNAVLDADLPNVVLVGDRGNPSRDNVAFLHHGGLRYVLALKRNSPWVRHAPVSAYRDHFLWRDRVVWVRSYGKGARRIHHYLDKALAAEEEKNFLRLVQDGHRTRAQFEKKRYQFGTFTVVTNTDLTAESCYDLYKQRVDIEQSFDALKNTLDEDKSYMQSRESLTGYYFVVFLSLYLYAGILNRLREKDLVRKYSVRDVLEYGRKIELIVEGETERVGDTPKKVRELFEELDLVGP